MIYKEFTRQDFDKVIKELKESPKEKAIGEYIIVSSKFNEAIKGHVNKGIYVKNPTK